MNKRISMRKIAEVANVSVATVSQVLNNRCENFCSEKTKERVRQVAMELGYRKNVGYKIMHSLPTHTVGILAASINMQQEEHLQTIIIQLLSEFASRDYAAFCNVLPPEPAGAYAAITDLVSRGVEHFVFLGTPPGLNEIVKELDRLGITWICDRVNTLRFVANDYISGGEKLYQSFYKYCGENFRLILNGKQDYNVNSRIQALLKTFPQYSEKEILEKFVYFTNIDETIYSNMSFFNKGFELGKESLKLIIKDIPDIAGISFINDVQAMGGASLLLTTEYQNYRHLKIAGYNKDNATKYYPYPISSVGPNIELIVKKLVDYTISNEACNLNVEPILSLRMDEKFSI
jgi:LacI family transcriptional regulator